jgi:hypothetical protein
MQYLLSYAEESSGPGSDTWTMRQVGVFHRFVPTGPGSLWVFLHAKPNTRLQQRLEEATSRWEQSAPRQRHWHFMHLLVLSTYLNNWRWYLRSLVADFEKIVSTLPSPTTTSC